MKQNAFRTSLSTAVLLCVVFSCSGNAPPELHITSLGNEGFFIEAGSSTVIVDGLYRGLGGYVKPSEQQRRARERAEPPFDKVDLVLVTHNHPDYFDAAVVASHLEANTDAVLITTPMAVDLLREEGERFRSISERVHEVYPPEGESEYLEAGEIEIEVLNLHHGRNRSLQVENLGFVVEMNGVSFLHLGDTLATPEELSGLDLAQKGIDLAFVPYWHLLDAKTAGDYVDVIGASKFVAMHMPAADAPPCYLDPAANLEGLIQMVAGATPGVLVLTEVMEERKIRTGD